MDKLISEYEETKLKYNEIVVQSFSKEDFTNYLESLFTAYSCAIEGNTFSVNETMELKEKGISFMLQNKSLFEAFEILDHFKAYEKMMSNLNRTLTEDFLKELHFTLTEHTIEYRKRGKPGEYTTLDMMAGDTMFGDHQKNISRVPVLLEQVEKAMDNNTWHPVEISAIFHKHFIYLHPFRDGNGRLGRLVSNFILAKKKEPLIIIESKDKKSYIDALKASEKHNNMTPIVSYFFSTSIDRMNREIRAKKNLTQNFFLKFRREPSKEKLTRPKGFKR
ncbi:Fic family protein [Ornithobacterium rhinotracheale]